MKKYGNIRNFYGIIDSGNGKYGCNIKSNDLPIDHQEAYVRRINSIIVVNIYEEEIEYDHTDVEELEETTNNKERVESNPSICSQ